jgi:predicted acyltransferase
VIDVAGWRRWTFPLVVVGMNSIAIYCMSMLLKPSAAAHAQDAPRRNIFLLAGPACEPTLNALLVGSIFWLACYWLYRQKIFIRI